MTSALLFAYTDPNTGATYPQAYLVIEDVRAHLATGMAILGISVYATQALHDAGKSPIWHEPDFYMTGAEIETERPKFLDDLYGLLVNRTQFNGATLVT